jgi:hypothetical protein
LKIWTTATALPAGQSLLGPEESATATEFSATRDFSMSATAGQRDEMAVDIGSSPSMASETPTAW